MAPRKDAASREEEMTTSQSAVKEASGGSYGFTRARGVQNRVKKTTRRGKGPKVSHDEDLLVFEPTTTNARLDAPLNSTQLHLINKFFENQGLTEKVNKLPPSSEWTFVAIGESRIKDEYTLDMKLFCGEVPAYQTWAIVKAYKGKVTRTNGKATKVLFVNEYRTGVKDVVVDFEDLALMYPLKVFKKFGQAHSMTQLKTLILYLFLDNGCATKVFPSDWRPAKTFLSSAIKRISDAYDVKGIENVPNLHVPSEDFSFQLGGYTRKQVDGTIHEYDDDTKTLASDDSDDDVTEEAQQPSADNALPPLRVFSTRRPRLPLPVQQPTLSVRDDLGSPLHVSFAEEAEPLSVDNSPPPIQISSHKRPSRLSPPPAPRPTVHAEADPETLVDPIASTEEASQTPEEEDNIAKLLRLKRARKELAREVIAVKEEAMKKCALIRIRDREMKDSMETLLEEMTKEEICNGILRDEIEE